MKTVHVAGAIIVHGGRLLACQRGYGAMKDGWEFPGGKVEPGESAADACRREIREELGCDLDTVDYYHTIEYDYPDFHLSMDCFVCTLAAHESPQLLEHEAARWLGREELRGVDWLPADEGLIARIADEWDAVVNRGLTAHAPRDRSIASDDELNDALERGWRDVQEGRVTPLADAMAQVRGDLSS